MSVVACGGKRPTIAIWLAKPVKAAGPVGFSVNSTNDGSIVCESGNALPIMRAPKCSITHEIGPCGDSGVVKRTARELHLCLGDA